MPNHVINEVVFSADADKQQRIIALACNADRKVDFEVLLPMPSNVWRGNVGSNHTAAFGEDCIGLDWARKNWGTKWNAYSHKETEQTADTLILRFETAWSPPYPWLVALFNTCGGFSYNWLDEGASWARSGRFETDSKFGGPEWAEDRADETTHRRLHKLHWGVEEFEDEDQTNEPG